MDEYIIQSAIDISIIEILLISIIAFVGAFTHEYISFIHKGKRITFNMWCNIFITVIIDIIISVSINPFIVSINPRLILLPPLLIGLLGTELAKRLTTISGSASLLEYILGFFKIKRADTTKTPKDDDYIYAAKDEVKDIMNKQQLDDEIISIQIQMEVLSEEYKINKDTTKFIEVYKFIKLQSSLIKDKIRDRKDIPTGTMLKLSEMLKAEVAMDKIYENILSGHK